MFKIPLSEIKQKITDSKKLTLEQLDARIKEKINELSGLISEEGAAHIIANELGIELVNLNQSKLKLKELYAGMRNIGAVGKVVRKFEVREFSKEGRSGKVASLLLGDETGMVRLVFWNEQADLLAKVQEEDIVAVKNAYVKENSNGFIEVHLSKEGGITINPKGETVGPVRQRASYERKSIGTLQPNEENVELIGTVVQVFDPRFFYVCPQCSKKAFESTEGFQCNEHGKVQPASSYVMNLILDDGTGTIRGVFWKNQTINLLGKEETEIAAYKDNLASFENVKTDLLGEQFKLKGRVKKNEMFDRLEFNVQIVEKVNPQEEIARLEKS